MGWYFFDGAREKNLSRDFSSAPFLAGAQGFLADAYKSGLPDYHGWTTLIATPLEDRPNPHDPRTAGEAWQNFNQRAYAAWRDQVVDDWGRYKDKVSAHFGFDAEQSERAGKLFAYYEGRLANHLADNREDLEEYRHELFRLDQMQLSPSAGSVPFEQSRVGAKRAEIAAQGATLRRGIESIEDDYIRELEEIATADQIEQRGNTPKEVTALQKFDTFLTYIHFVIGACLIIGLLTRLAAFGAGTFLLLVVLSRPPWDVGYQMIGYQIVMMFACFALMAIGAGRWAGLDYFYHRWRSGECCSTSKSNTDKPAT